jgi:hypothetical protein
LLCNSSKVEMSRKQICFHPYGGYVDSCRSKLFRSTSWQAVLPQIFTRITLLSSLVAIANCLCCLQVFGCFSNVQNTLSEIKYLF